MDIISHISNSLALFFDRDKGFKQIAKKSDLGVAIISLFLVYLIAEIFTVAFNGTADNLLIGVLTAVIGSLIGTLFLGFVGYGIVHLLLKMFGGKAQYLDTVKFGLSLGILGGVLQILGSFIPMNLLDNNMVAIPLLGLILAFGIWVLIVSAAVFSKAHKITKTRALLALLIPMIVVLLLVLVVGASVLLLSDSMTGY